MTTPAVEVVPRPSPELGWVTVDDRIVLLDTRGRAHVIGSTGALLWPHLDGVTSVTELAADVADVFAIDADDALGDVRRFVDEMVGLGLVTVAPPAEGWAGPTVEDSAPVRPELVEHQPRSPMAPAGPDWLGGVLVDVGGRVVRLHADSSSVLELLRDVFGPWVVADGAADREFGISVERRGGTGPRLIPQLLEGDHDVLRSRSLPRLLRRLDLALAGLDRRAEGTAVRGMSAFVRHDGAVLIPISVAERSTDVERAVARAGATIAEAASLRIDLDAGGKVTVLSGLDRAAPSTHLVDDLATPPGRYELRAVVWSEDQVVDDDEGPATAVARLAELLDLSVVADRQRALEQIVVLRDRFIAGAIPRWGADVSAALRTLH